MTVLRSLLFAVIQAVFTVPFSLLALACYPLDPVRRNHVLAQWARFVVWLARWLLGIRYHVIGLEFLPPGPCVVLSKHQSAWETFAFQLIFPPLCFVLKRELLRIPFFGWGLAMTSPIAIDREAGRASLRQMEEQGRNRVDRGLWIVIFPEGTRMAPGTRGRYNVGGAYLATRLGIPVVPVAHDAGRLWGKNALIKYPGEITMVIGPAIDPRGRKAAEINAQVEDWIEGQMDCLGTGQVPAPESVGDAA